jgi:putative DNA primase/helicase
MNSLSIGEGADGRALLFCHAGCSLNEVVTALGIRVRDLFVQRGRR